MKLLIVFMLLLAACRAPRPGKFGTLPPAATIEVAGSTPLTTVHPSTATIPPAPAASATPRPSATATASPLVAPTQSPTRTLKATITASATYSILRGTVLQRSNCRYGPGWAYLYKYGLLIGNHLEVIGRNPEGTWILVRAIGGDNPCWLRADLMNIEGDVMSVAPAEIKLPFSPYYGPLSGVWAERIGIEVLISWNEMRLRPGDDSGQYLYLVEAWVCQGGEIVFLPIGTNEDQLRVVDELGCAEPSMARVYGVEKHGYTLWMKAPWPER